MIFETHETHVRIEQIIPTEARQDRIQRPVANNHCGQTQDYADETVPQEVDIQDTDSGNFVLLCQTEEPQATDQLPWPRSCSFPNPPTPDQTNQNVY